MTRVWSVARKELRAFFDHATAYVLVVAFLGLALFLTFRSLYTLGTADLRSFFAMLIWLLPVFVPAVTMRALAEERSRGTLDWLIAQPLSEGQLVLGKFLGCWFFVLATLAGALPTVVGVLVLGDAPAGPAVAQSLGAALLAGQMVAIGLFASALTRNQITAFILAATLCFALVLIGLPFTLVGLPPALATPISSLSVVPHYDSVVRGVIDLRDVLYFVSTAALFTALAHFLVLRERLSAARGAYRRLRIGLAAAALVVVFLNLVGGRIHGRLDLTPDRLYTLSDGTEAVLQGLTDVVTVKLYVSDALPPEIQVTLRDTRDLLSDYSRRSDGNVRVTELHPDQDSTVTEEARQAGIREIQFNVMREDEFEVRSGWLGLSIQYADALRSVPFIASTEDLEYRLTSAVSAMTRTREPTVAFLAGYGARAGLDLPELQQLLEDNYWVRTLSLEGDSVPSLGPDSLDVFVVAGPTQPLSLGVAQALDAYLEAGGAALLLLESNQPSTEMPISQLFSAGLEWVLEKRGLALAPSLVFDMRSHQTVSLGRQAMFNVASPYPLWPIGLPAMVDGERHPVTANLESLTLAWAAPLDISDPDRVRALWTTTEAGGRLPSSSPIDPQVPIQADPGELSTQVLAAAVSSGTNAMGEEVGGRMVVVGDADFVDSRFVQAAPQNAVFVANAVDWLAQEDALIQIRSKDRTPPPLVFESDVEEAALRWANLGGVPALFVALGLVRAWLRRRRAEELWSQVQAEGRGAPKDPA